VSGDDRYLFPPPKKAPHYETLLRDISGKSIPAPPDLHGSMIFKGSDDDPSVWFVFDIRNIGTGLAIVTSLTVELGDGVPGGTFFIPIWAHLLQEPISQVVLPQIPAIPPGEHTLFVARIDDPNGEVFGTLSGVGPQRIPRNVDTTFICRDLAGQATYTMRVNWGWNHRLLLPGTPIYEGYDLDGIDDLASQP
jgi:hypothetical protein